MSNAAKHQIPTTGDINKTYIYDEANDQWDLSPLPGPWDHNLLAWSYDPVGAINNSVVTGGVLYLIKVRMGPAATITNVIVQVAIAGTTLTADQNFAALYDSAGTRVGVTADQTTAWGSTGTKTMALTTPYVAAAGTYYVGLLANGTTPPQFARSSGFSLINVGLSAGSYRYSTSGTAQTATPASVTLASAAAASISYWAALS